MTTIVNLRQTNDYDVKICRDKTGVTQVPQPGCFGNPFGVEKFGREKCLELYRGYFYARIDSDAKFREAVLSLKGKTLACFCKPEACHGDIIKEWLDTQ